MKSSYLGAFTAGVLSVNFLPQLPPLLWLPVLIILPLLLFGRARRWRGPLLMGVLAFAYTVIYAQHQLNKRWSPERHGEDITLSGFVASLPEQNGTTWRFRFSPIGDEDNQEPAHAGDIRVSWYKSDDTIRAADCWTFTLRMRTPHGSQNPHGFDYEAWLLRERLSALGTVRKARRCDANSNDFLLITRSKIKNALDAALPPNQAALVSALLIGDRSGLSDEHWRVFRETGTSHLMAISGLHIGLLATFAFFLGRWLWVCIPKLALIVPAQLVGWICSVFAATVYAALSGFGVPSKRALVMVALVALAGIRGKLNQRLMLLMLAWVAVLLLDPLAPLSIGTWLSFAAVGVILYLFEGRIAAPKTWKQKSVALIKLQLAFALLLAPLTLYFFQGVSITAPLINLFAVPLFAVFLPLLFIAAAISWQWLVPLHYAATALEWIYHSFAWAANQFSSSWIWQSPDTVALVLALAGALILCLPRGFPQRGVGLCLILPLMLSSTSGPRQGFTATVLDVGQGLAVLVRTAEHTLLFDAGPAFPGGFDSGESIVLPYLRGEGIRRIDHFIVSHQDNDHIGGSKSVLNGIKVAQFTGGHNTVPCRQGMSWNWDGVEFETLHPNDAKWSDNNSSCVLRISYKGSVLLLTGDIEKEAERRLIRERSGDLKAQVMVVPHHGSKTSSSTQFIHSVNPEFVIYSAGWKNHFNHPHPAVRKRYQENDSTELITGYSGAVKIEFTGPKFFISNFRKTNQRYWFNKVND